MKDYNVDINKLDKMAGLTFQNTLRLHFDSIILFYNKSYPSAFYLSVLALEELGKYYNLDHFIFHSRVEGRMGENMDRKILEGIFIHKYKQMWFVSTNMFDLSKGFQDKVNQGKLEIEKQNSLYVGLPKFNRKIDLKGKIINPLSVSMHKAKKQITILNDCLLEQCLIVVKEVGCLDSYYAEDFINQKLIDKIESGWIYNNRVTLKRIKQLKEII